MSGVRATVLLVAGCALAGCGRSDPAPPAAVVSRPSPISAAPIPAAKLAGIGSALSGSVSPLNGSVTGFSVRVTDTATVVALDADILFDFDSATLRPTAAAQLGRTVDLIRAGGTGAVAITGYTDSKGGDAYNLDLSRRRAEAVAAWLRGQPGVRDRTYTIVGKGKAEPVAANARPDGSDDPAGRARNRRVEIAIPR